MTSTTMHSSLRARTNVVMACVWLAGLVVVVLLLGRVPWTMVIAGAVSGLLQGALQRHALGEATARFLKAQSPLEVRGAMMSTAAGRAQIAVLWASFALLFALAFAQSKERGPLALLPLLVSGVLAQWFVRESIVVGACIRLEKAGTVSDRVGDARAPDDSR
jgi:hypothetical protein